MVISSVGSSNGGSRFRGDWGLHHKEAEYGSAIYCDAANSKPLQTICSEAGNLGVSAVVGAGGN